MGRTSRQTSSFHRLDPTKRMELPPPEFGFHHDGYERSGCWYNCQRHAVYEYELERIKAYRVFRGKLQYRVDWMGYDPDDTWYPARDLKNSPYAIWTYHEQHPEGPPPPKRLSEWASCFEAEERSKKDPDHPDDDKPEPWKRAKQCVRSGGRAEVMRGVL